MIGSFTEVTLCVSCWLICDLGTVFMDSTYSNDGVSFLYG